MTSSRRSSRPRAWTQISSVSCIGRRLLVCNFCPLSPLGHYFCCPPQRSHTRGSEREALGGWLHRAGEAALLRPEPSCPPTAPGLRHHGRCPGQPLSLSMPSGFPQGGAPETAAVSSCTLSFNLSRALKLQLPGICSLWLWQREGLFEKQIPELWTIPHGAEEAMKPM